ncbi:MAG: shikimate kinase [Desulfobulbus sp.]|nr:MAG: shikimate kinase [Desulfobulbus sp.]
MISLSRQDGKKQASCIVLTGFRATGKTAVGRLLAELLGYHFIDTDEEVVKRLGCSIRHSVERFGWQPFRNLEQQLLAELCGCKKTVLATGGGAVLHREAWRKLSKTSFVVWLQAETATIMTRLEGDSKTPAQRPSLVGGDLKKEITKMLKERTPLYRSGSDMHMSTENTTPAELASTLYRLLGEDINMV